MLACFNHICFIACKLLPAIAIGECKLVKERSAKTTGKLGRAMEERRNKKNSSFELVKPDGSEIPVQTWDLAYWPDGSVKWTALAAVADSTAKDLKIIRVKNMTQVKSPVQVINERDSIYLSTGAMKCVIPQKGSVLIAFLHIDDKLIAEMGRLQCILQHQPDGDLEGSSTKEKLSGIIEQTNIEQYGPVRGVVRINGHFQMKLQAKKCCLLL
jgi:hypothetical protein